VNEAALVSRVCNDAHELRCKDIPAGGHGEQITCLPALGRETAGNLMPSE
jgi:hypothetical protein